MVKWFYAGHVLLLMMILAMEALEPLLGSPPMARPILPITILQLLPLYGRQNVGSGGTGCGASGSTAWTCTTVDNDTDNTGWSTMSIAFAPNGNFLH